MVVVIDVMLEEVGVVMVLVVEVVVVVVLVVVAPPPPPPPRSTAVDLRFKHHNPQASALSKRIFVIK